MKKLAHWPPAPNLTILTVERDETNWALGAGVWNVGRASLSCRNATSWRPKHVRPPASKLFLLRHWTEGNRSVRLLFGEIQQQGYTGSYSHLARFIATWKDSERPQDVIAEATV